MWQVQFGESSRILLVRICFTFQCKFGYQIKTNITEKCLLPNIVSSSDTSLLEIEGSFVMFNEFRREERNISCILTRDSVMRYLFVIMLLLGMTHTRLNTSWIHIVYNFKQCWFFFTILAMMTWLCSKKEDFQQRSKQ